MKTSICILLIISPLFCPGQSINPSRGLLPNGPDSCHLTIYEVVTKEKMAMLDEKNSVFPATEQERKIELGLVNISTSDMNRLMKKILKRSSYKNSRALLTHSNMVFEFFNNQSPVMKISISSITGNVDITNLLNEGEFHGGISKKFGKYLLQLLDQYALTALIDSEDLQGLKQADEYH